METVIESNIKQNLKSNTKQIQHDQQHVDILISLSSFLSNDNDTNTKIQIHEHTERRYEFFIIECVCNSIFTLEIC